MEQDFRLVHQAAALRHSVVDSIRTAIATGRFAPGARLPERDLCAMTDVGRTPVREALRQFGIRRSDRRPAHLGPRVSRLSPDQATGIYQVRRELEGLAAELFATRASDAERRVLVDAFQQLKRAATSKDALVRLDAKNRFYDGLIAGSGNEAIGQTLRTLNSRIVILRATSLRTPGRARQSLAERGALVEALLAGDPVAARAAAARHVIAAEAVAVAHLRLATTSP